MASRVCKHHKVDYTPGYDPEVKAERRSANCSGGGELAVRLLAKALFKGEIGTVETMTNVALKDNTAFKRWMDYVEANYDNAMRVLTGQREKPSNGKS